MGAGARGVEPGVAVVTGGASGIGRAIAARLVRGAHRVVLTDRDFGDWAKPLWPALSDEVLREIGAD